MQFHFSLLIRIIHNMLVYGGSAPYRDKQEENKGYAITRYVLSGCCERRGAREEAETVRVTVGVLIRDYYDDTGYRSSAWPVIRLLCGGTVVVVGSRVAEG